MRPFEPQLGFRRAVESHVEEVSEIVRVPGIGWGGRDRPTIGGDGYLVVS
jgi:hypothetical protein